MSMTEDQNAKNYITNILVVLMLANGIGSVIFLGIWINKSFDYAWDRFKELAAEALWD